MIAGAVYLGYVISKRYFSLTIFELFLFAPIILSAAAGYCLNDLVDLKEDRINRPERILVKNLMSVKACWFFSFSLFLISLAISAIRFNLLIFNLALITSVITYDFFLKKTPLAGNLFTSVLSSLPVLWGSLINSSVTRETLCIFLLAFSLHIPREILKDIEDIKGDKYSEKSTSAVFFGIKTALLMSLSFSAIALAVILISSFYLIDCITTRFLFISVTSSLVVLSAFFSFKTRNFKNPSLFIKFSMISATLILIVEFAFFK